MDSQYFIASPSFRSALMALVSEDGARLHHDIVYEPSKGLSLDIYEPEHAETQPVTLVFYFGGGWTSGDKGLYAFLGSAFASRGYRTVVPNYRVHPDAVFPDFLHDCARSFAWTLDRFGSDQRYVVMGHSAGAYNAAFLAFDDDLRSRVAPSLRRPDAFVGLSGPYAFDPLNWQPTRHIFPDIKTSNEARPVASITRGAPKTLLLHGDDDDYVQPWNAREVRKALIAVDTPVVMKFYDRVGHMGVVSALAPPLRWRAPVLSDILDFLKAV